MTDPGDDVAIQAARVRAEAAGMDEDTIRHLGKDAERRAAAGGDRMVITETRRLARDALARSRQMTALLNQLAAILGDEDRQ